MIQIQPKKLKQERTETEVANEMKGEVVNHGFLRQIKAKDFPLTSSAGSDEDDTEVEVDQPKSDHLEQDVSSESLIVGRRDSGSSEGNSKSSSSGEEEEAEEGRAYLMSESGQVYNDDEYEDEEEDEGELEKMEEQPHEPTRKEIDAAAKLLEKQIRVMEATARKEKLRKEDEKKRKDLLAKQERKTEAYWDRRFLPVGKQLQMLKTSMRFIPGENIAPNVQGRSDDPPYLFKVPGRVIDRRPKNTYTLVYAEDEEPPAEETQQGDADPIVTIKLPKIAEEEGESPPPTPEPEALAQDYRPKFGLGWTHHKNQLIYQAHYNLLVAFINYNYTATEAEKVNTCGAAKTQVQPVQDGVTQFQGQEGALNNVGNELIEVEYLDENDLDEYGRPKVKIMLRHRNSIAALDTVGVNVWIEGDEEITEISYLDHNDLDENGQPKLKKMRIRKKIGSGDEELVETFILDENDLDEYGNPKVKVVLRHRNSIAALQTVGAPKVWIDGNVEITEVSYFDYNDLDEFGQPKVKKMQIRKNLGDNAALGGMNQQGQGNNDNDLIQVEFLDFNDLDENGQPKLKTVLRHRNSIGALDIVGGAKVWIEGDEQITEFTYLDHNDLDEFGQPKLKTMRTRNKIGDNVNVLGDDFVETVYLDYNDLDENGQPKVKVALRHRNSIAALDIVGDPQVWIDGDVEVTEISYLDHNDLDEFGQPKLKRMQVRKKIGDLSQQGQGQGQQNYDGNELVQVEIIDENDLDENGQPKVKIITRHRKSIGTLDTVGPVKTWIEGDEEITETSYLDHNDLDEFGQPKLKTMRVRRKIGPMGQPSQMGGPQGQPSQMMGQPSQMMGGPEPSQMGGPQWQPSQMGGPQGQPSQMMGQPSQMMGEPEPSQMGGSQWQPSQMGGPQGQPSQMMGQPSQMMSGPEPSQMGGPQWQPSQMGGPQGQPGYDGQGDNPLIEVEIVDENDLDENGQPKVKVILRHRNSIGVPADARDTFDGGKVWIEGDEQVTEMSYLDHHDLDENGQPKLKKMRIRKKIGTESVTTDTNGRRQRARPSESFDGDFTDLRDAPMTAEEKELLDEFTRNVAIQVNLDYIEGSLDLGEVVRKSFRLYSHGGSIDIDVDPAALVRNASIQMTNRGV